MGCRLSGQLGVRCRASSVGLRRAWLSHPRPGVGLRGAPLPRGWDTSARAGAPSEVRAGGGGRPRTALTTPLSPSRARGRCPPVGNLSSSPAASAEAQRGNGQTRSGVTGGGGKPRRRSRGRPFSPAGRQEAPFNSLWRGRSGAAGGGRRAAAGTGPPSPARRGAAAGARPLLARFGRHHQAPRSKRCPAPRGLRPRSSLQRRSPFGSCPVVVVPVPVPRPPPRAGCGSPKPPALLGRERRRGASAGVPSSAEDEIKNKKKSARY